MFFLFLLKLNPLSTQPISESFVWLLARNTNIQPLFVDFNATFTAVIKNWNTQCLFTEPTPTYTDRICLFWYLFPHSTFRMQDVSDSSPHTRIFLCPVPNECSRGVLWQKICTKLLLLDWMLSWHYTDFYSLLKKNIYPTS